MATLEELVVSLVAETSGLKAELNAAAKVTKDAASKMDDAIAAFSENSSKNVGFFESAMATATGFLASQAVLGAFNMVKDAAAALGQELLEGAQSAIAEEQALTRLANSLALSGNYSDAALKSLKDFTGQMETQTGVADDVVASNLAMLSSLTKLDAEGLKAAQKAALDLSAATGKDLESATQMVAKSINGSSDAFKKMGITIVESTDKAQALHNTISVLNGQFGGAAAGAAKTFQGSLTNMNNAWGNLTESIATAITQNPVIIAMFNKVAEILSDLTTEADGAGISLKEGVAKAIFFVGDALQVTIGTIDTFYRAFSAAIQGLQLGLEAIAGGINYVADALGLIEDKEPFQRLNEKSESLFQTINGETALSSFAGKLAEVQYAGESAYGSIQKSSEGVKATIENQTKTVGGLSEEYKTLLTTYATGLAEQGAALDNHYLYENELRATNLELALAQEGEFSLARQELMATDFEARNEAMLAQQEVERTNLETAHANNLISEQQYQSARLALAQKQNLELKKFELDKTQTEKEQQKTRQANLESTLGTIATLQQSSSKELQAIGKAAAIAQATIDGYAAVQKALAAAPPPYNFALAALVGTATAVNIAKIAGIGLKDGGTIMGGGANVDTVPATLAKGETVVSRGLTEQLQEFLNNGGRGEQRIVLELRSREGFIEWVEAQIVERQTSNVSLLQAAT